MKSTFLEFFSLLEVDRWVAQMKVRLIRAVPRFKGDRQGYAVCYVNIINAGKSGSMKK